MANKLLEAAALPGINVPAAGGKSIIQISPKQAIAMAGMLHGFDDKVRATISGMGGKLYSWLLNMILATPGRDAGVYDQIMLMAWLGDAGYKQLMTKEGIDVGNFSYDFLTITSIGADGKLRIDPGKLQAGDVINTSWLRSRVAWPGLGELYQLWNRGLLDDACADKMMRSAGYADSGVRKVIADLRYVVPSDGELVQYAAKGAINPNTIDMYGYYTEMPTRLYPFSNANGLGGDTNIFYPKGLDDSGNPIDAGKARWLDVEWVNHWQIPMPMEGYRMRQMLYGNSPYGKSPRLGDMKPFTDDDLLHMYQCSNVPPYWRKYLDATSWNTLARREINQLFIHNIVERSEVYHAYRADGYSDKDAEVLTEYADIQKHDYYISKYGDPAAKHVCLAMTIGVITPQDAEDKITDLIDDRQLAEVMVQGCGSDAQMQRIRQRISIVQKRFLKGSVSTDEARRQLTILGIVPDRLAAYLDDWEAEKEETGVEVKVSEILDWYRNMIISKNDAFNRLLNLGYQPNDATSMLVRVDQKIALDIQKHQQKALKQEQQAYKQKQQQQKQQQAAIQKQQKQIQADTLKTQKQAQQLLTKQLVPFTDKNMKAWYMRKLFTEQQVKNILQLREWTTQAIDLWWKEFQDEITMEQIAQSKPKTPSQVTEG